MARTFPEFDPEADVIRLNGGREIMLTLLQKAKFGERFDPETLLHRDLSKLIRDLSSQSHGACPFTPDDLHRIGTVIYYETHRVGWWSMSPEEKASYVLDVVAPWNLSASEIESVIECVDTLRFRNGQILEAANKAEGR